MTMMMIVGSNENMNINVCAFHPLKRIECYLLSYIPDNITCKQEHRYTKGKLRNISGYMPKLVFGLFYDKGHLGIFLC